MDVEPATVELQRALEVTPAAALLIDRDRGPIWANRAARILAGVVTDGVDAVARSRLAWAVATSDAVSGAFMHQRETSATAKVPADVGLLERVITAVPVNTDVVVATFAPASATEVADEEFRARLEAMLEHTTDIITVLERDGTIRFSNSAAGRLTGLAGSTVNGRAALDLVHPDDIDRVATAFAEALATAGRGPVLEFRLRFADGAWHYLEASVNNLLGVEPIDGLIVTLHDVTERKRSEARLQSLIANLSEVIVLLNDRFEVTYASNSISQLIEAAPETNLGMSAFNDVHPDDLPIAIDALGKIVEEPVGATTRVEVRIESRPGSGKWRWVEATVVNRLADPAVESLVLTLRDVTESKRASEELQAALERERANAQRLRELDELKDEFLSTVSHELRTPLAAIVGFADLLNSAAHDPEVHGELAGRISASAADMRAMIDNVLDFSALEAGRVALRKERVVVAELVDRTLAAIAHQVADHHVSVEIDAAIAVTGDARGVGHVIRNLVTNAAKYSPPGTTISIGARREDGLVTVEIADEGIGIEPELQERIFDRFYRAATASFTARGSGVGLNIVKRYTELMDGTVRVSSSPGRGSVFTIVLPSG